MKHVIKILVSILLLTPGTIYAVNFSEKYAICTTGIDQTFELNTSNERYVKVLLCKQEKKTGAKDVYLIQNSQINFIDRYYPEGNDAKVKLCFLRHIKGGKELVILETWEQRLYDTAEGNLYQVHLYSIRDISHNFVTKKLEDLFPYEFEGMQEGKQIKAKYITKKAIEQKIQNIFDIDMVLKRLKDKKIHSMNLPFINELFANSPLSSRTLTQYNNIAYYLQKAGANEEAVYLLKKIVAKFPNRTVAYINLGDAYWELGEKEKARKAYTTYIEQMCNKGLQKKIPQEVLKRVEKMCKNKKMCQLGMSQRAVKNVKKHGINIPICDWRNYIQKLNVKPLIS